MPSTTNIIRQNIQAGKREFTLPTESLRKSFYSACKAEGHEHTVRRVHTGWKGIVGHKLVVDPTEVEFLKKPDFEAIPVLFPPEIPVDKNNQPLRKFVKVEKPNEIFPTSWYFLCKKHNAMVQPRYSLSPLAALCNIVKTPGTIDEEEDMLACNEKGALLGWPLTLARSVRSIPTGTREILPEAKELAWEHLLVLDPSMGKEKFFKLIDEENLLPLETM